MKFQLLCALVGENDAPDVPALNVIVYFLCGFVIALLKFAESYVAVTLFVPAVVAFVFVNVIVYVFADQCAYNV